MRDTEGVTLADRDWTPPNGDAWPEGLIIFSRADARQYLGVSAHRISVWVDRNLVKRGPRDGEIDMGSLMTYLWQRQQAGTLDG